MSVDVSSRSKGTHFVVFADLSSLSFSVAPERGSKFTLSKEFVPPLPCLISMEILTTGAEQERNTEID